MHVASFWQSDWQLEPMKADSPRTLGTATHPSEGEQKGDEGSATNGECNEPHDELSDEPTGLQPAVSEEVGTCSAPGENSVPEHGDEAAPTENEPDSDVKSSGVTYACLGESSVPAEQEAFTQSQGKEAGSQVSAEEVSEPSKADADSFPSGTKAEEPQPPSPSPESQPMSLETKKMGPAQKARQAAVRRAALVAEEVLGKPVEYSVVAETPLYGEPQAASPLSKSTLKPGTKISGYPGNASWVRLVGAEEEWAPVKSPGPGKEVLLCPTWAQLQSEEVFSEALMISWSGLAAPKPPYVAAYSVEWRLTPGEELPIGAGDGEDFKKSGYALSLQPRALAVRNCLKKCMSVAPSSEIGLPAVARSVLRRILWRLVAAIIFHNGNGEGAVVLLVSRKAPVVQAVPHGTKPKVRGATLHGLPPGAAVQLRAGVRVAAQSAGQADFRLLGPWQDFTTGSPLTEEEEAEPSRSIDPFGAARGDCESSQCRGYVADLDALASVGANANFMVQKAICIRCGKSFEAHRRLERTEATKKKKKVTEASTGKPPEDDNNLKNFQESFSVSFGSDLQKCRCTEGCQTALRWFTQWCSSVIVPA